MIQFRILTEVEIAQAEYDGVPATIEIRYAGQVQRAVLEQRVETENLFDWVPVEVSRDRDPT